MILVTGATGFVGSALVAELCHQGKGVRCLVRPTSRPIGLRLEGLNSLGVELAYGDVTQPQTLGPALEGVEGVVHLAAIIIEKGRATFSAVNWQGTRNLVTAAARAGVGRFVYMSNIGAGPDRRFPFLHSKWRAEEEVRGSGLPHTIFRASIIFGPGDKFITTLADLSRRLPLVPVLGSGRTRFQPVLVGEVARCLAQALDDPARAGQTLYLGGPEHLSYEDILDTIMAVLGRRQPKLHIPVALMRPLVWAMEKFMAQPPVTTQQLAMLSQDNITELDAIERAFGFKPTALRQGIGYIR